jgi:hypothetical protein
MVALSVVELSNSPISTTLPAKMVAVFVGATGGIGEYAMKAFAQKPPNPRSISWVVHKTRPTESWLKPSNSIPKANISLSSLISRF